MKELKSNIAERSGLRNAPDGSLGMQEPRSRRALFPIVRHQIIPSAIQGATNPGNGGDKRVYLACFNAPDTSRVYIHKFRHSLLSHAQGRADAANVAAEFPKIGGCFRLNHSILRENYTIDIKGLIRPNRTSRHLGLGDEQRRMTEKEYHFT
jgi:hypothetical protein